MSPSKPLELSRILWFVWSSFGKGWTHELLWREEKSAAFWVPLPQPIPPFKVLLIPNFCFLGALTHVLIYIYLLTCTCTYAYMCIFVMIYLQFLQMCKYLPRPQGNCLLGWVRYIRVKLLILFDLQNPKANSSHQKVGTPLPFFRDLFVIRPKARSWQNNQSIFTFAIKESHPSRDRLDAFLAIIMRRTTMDKSMGTCQTDQHVKNPSEAYQ